MSNQSGSTSRNGPVVGIAIVVAGLVGTLAVSIFGRSDKKQTAAQTQIEQRLERLEASANQAYEQLVNALAGLRNQGAGDSGHAQAKARDVGRSASKAIESAMKSTRKRLAEIDLEARQLKAIEKANQLGHESSERASEFGRNLSHRSSELMAEVKANAPGLRDKATQVVTDAAGVGTALAHQTRDKAPEVRELVSKAASDAAAKGAEIATQAIAQAPAALDKTAKALHDVADQGATIASQARERSPDLREQASKAAHDVTQHAKAVVPETLGVVSAHVASTVHSAQSHARPIYDDATLAAVKALEQAKSGAKDAGKRAADAVVPEIHHRADVVTEKVSAQRQAALSSINALSASATGKIAHTSDVIENKSKSAATAAGRGTKDAGALIVWLTAAAGVAFFAFLNEEQRQKVKQSGKRIADEVREVINDIRGQDEEFA